MSAARQWILIAVIVALLGGMLVVVTYATGDRFQQLTVGSRAPGFTALTLDDPPQERSLSAYSGHVVLLNIWATWCVPCRTEMPDIQALYDSMRDRGPGFRVVAVSIDEPGSREKIIEFAEELGLTFDILYDPEGRIRRTYQTLGVPETFLIGADGIVRRRVIGAIDWNSERNRAVVAALLGEPDGGRDGAAPAGRTSAAVAGSY